MSIEVKDLTKIYGEQKAVDGISFKLNAGEIVGFLGPNGAGKSTTMKIICGYLQPTSGQAFVCDMDVAEKPVSTKQKIGYLPEHNPLYLDMFVTEFLQFVASIYKIKNAKAKIEEVILKTGLGPERKKKIAMLSKGYRQRVGLAQALLNEPDVLILDEPTSGLDPNQVQDIRRLILEIGKDRTIMLSTHIMQEVEAVCSRVIIIDKGQIKADDTVENVKQKLGKGSSTVIKVAFRDEIDREKLATTKGVASVVREGNKWKVTASSKTDLAAVLFKFAVDNETIITEQVEATQSLESVFQSLTSKGNA